MLTLWRRLLDRFDHATNMEGQTVPVVLNLFLENQGKWLMFWQKLLKVNIDRFLRMIYWLMLCFFLQQVNLLMIAKLMLNTNLFLLSYSVIQTLCFTNTWLTTLMHSILDYSSRKVLTFWFGTTGDTVWLKQENVLCRGKILRILTTSKRMHRQF